MTASYFRLVSRWRLPVAAFRLSLEEMARDGREGQEGIALWLGTRLQGEALITDVVALRGKGIIKLPYQIRIESQLMTQVTDLALALDRVLIGHIHSHGPGYGTRLSASDRAYGFHVPGYLSAIAPDFALRPDTRITDCGVHVYDATNGYRRLSRREITQQVVIDPQGHVNLHVVTGDVTP